MPGTKGRCETEPSAYPEGRVHLENPPPATLRPAPLLWKLPGNRPEVSKAQLTSGLKLGWQELRRAGPRCVGTGGFNGRGHTAELGKDLSNLVICAPVTTARGWSPSQQRQLVQPAPCPQGPLGSSGWHQAEKGGWLVGGLTPSTGLSPLGLRPSCCSC